MNQRPNGHDPGGAPGGPHTITDGHIFISYKTEDWERVEPLAEALERRGWPVWWDRDIRPGESFRKVIAQALADAVCVVVAWSERSVDSEWVHEEAQVARHRDILVPAMLDDVRQPLGFGQLQAADVAGWGGAPDDPALEDLLTGVAALIGSGYVPPLLNEEEWEAIQEATRASVGRAQSRQAQRDQAAVDAAQVAIREREAADVAQARAESVAADGAVGDAATSLVAAKAAEQRELAEAAQRDAEDAEERAALAAADLAEERAVALRAAAAKAAEREARALAAEAAAASAETDRLAAASASERALAARQLEREATVKAAEERARAAQEAAARAVEHREAAAREHRVVEARRRAEREAAAAPAPRAATRQAPSAPEPPPRRPAPEPSRRKRRWPRRVALLVVVAGAGVGAAFVVNQQDSGDDVADNPAEPAPEVAQPDPDAATDEPSEAAQPDPDAATDEPSEAAEPDQDRAADEAPEVQGDPPGGGDFRITFETGASGAQIDGIAVSGVPLNYHLGASAGQAFLVEFISENGGFGFDLFDPNGSLIGNEDTVYPVRLPADGDYVIALISRSGAGAEAFSFVVAVA